MIAFWKIYLQHYCFFVWILLTSLVQNWWTETASLRAGNLSMGGLLDFNVFDVTKFWLVFFNHLQFKIFTLIFFAKMADKTRSFCIFSKGRHFILVAVGMWTLAYFEILCRLSKKCSFLKYYKNYINLNNHELKFKLPV